MKMQRRPRWMSNRSQTAPCRGLRQLNRWAHQRKTLAANPSVQEVAMVGFSALKTESRKIHLLFFLSLKMRAYAIFKSIVEMESRKFARQQEKKLNRNSNKFLYSQLWEYRWQNLRSNYFMGQRQMETIKDYRIFSLISCFQRKDQRIQVFI